uniref:Sentrin-specific protease 2 n=1 Tax=Lygus hesperus TaxID=30085 RepID=A0A0A9YVQ9_LYGHE
MDILQYFLSVLRSFCSTNTTNQNAETASVGNKRRRPNDDENDEIVVEDSPLKRQRVVQEDCAFHHATRNKPSSATQTTEKNINVVDFTNDDDSETEISTVDLTKRGMGRLNEFNVLSRTMRTPLVTPNVIDLDEDNETPTRRRVDRVNSFQEKLDENMNIKPDIISKGSIDHKFLQLKSNDEEKDKFEVSSSSVQEIVENSSLTHLKITEEEITTEKPVLTSQMLSEVRNAQNPALDPSQVLVSKFNLEIRRADFLTLLNMNWLNDNIINFYMELINQRSENNPDLPKTYAFNTFLYTSYLKSYNRVKNYSKKVNLMEKDIILFPVHENAHWRLVAVRPKQKTIEYYDSLSCDGKEILETIFRYIKQDFENKHDHVLDRSEWTFNTIKSIPQQNNSYDCGPFVCKFADLISQNKPLVLNAQKLREQIHKKHITRTLRRLIFFYRLASGALLALSAEISNIDNSGGLLPIELGPAYTETNEHLLIIHYDINELRSSLNDLYDIFQKFKGNLRTSKQTQALREYVRTIDSTLSIANEKFSNLKTRETLTKNRHDKRGLINGLGSVVKFITGNLDDEDRIKYDKLIKQLTKKNTQTAIQLEKEHRLLTDLIQKYNGTN